MPRAGLRSSKASSPVPKPGRPNKPRTSSFPPATPTSNQNASQPAAHRRSLRSHEGSNSQVHISLPVRKRRRSDMPPPLVPEKRRRTQEEVHVAAPAEADGFETQGDDESAPEEPGFYAHINNAVLQGNEHNQGNAQEQGRPVKRPVGRPKKKSRASRESHLALPTEQPQEEQAAEEQHAPEPPSRDVRPTSSPANAPRRGQRRQSRKVPYGEEGYQDPSRTSPELGSGFPVPPGTDTQAKKPQGRVAGNAKQAKRGRPRLSKPSPDEPQERAVEENLGDLQGLKEFASSADEEEESGEDEAPGGREADADQTQAVVDDSIFIEPPQDDNRIIEISISSEIMATLIYEMGMQGWANMGKQGWEKKLLPSADETDDGWMERHRHSVEDMRCKKLLKALYFLWNFLHEMPKAPSFDEQFQYLNAEEHGKVLAGIVSRINQKVGLICREISDIIGQTNVSHRKTRKAIASLYLRIIPMLGVILRESFMAGHAVSKFTSTTIQFPLRVAGWMERLYNTMQEYLETHPLDAGSEDDKRKVKARRDRLKGHLERLIREVRRGMDELDCIATAPERKQKAVRMDQARRVAREQQEHERAEYEERQMQLHIRSLAKIKQSRDEAQEARFQRYGAPAPLNDNPPQDEGGAYFEKHGGWYQWEDKRLLNIIRRTLEPNYQVLARLVPGRSVEEVEQRVMALQNRMREKYIASGIDPPLWCYHRG